MFHFVVDIKIQIRRILSSNGVNSFKLIDSFRTQSKVQKLSIIGLISPKPATPGLRIKKITKKIPYPQNVVILVILYLFNSDLVETSFLI